MAKTANIKLIKDFNAIVIKKEKPDNRPQGPILSADLAQRVLNISNKLTSDVLPDSVTLINEAQWLLLAGWYGSETCLACERSQ